MLNIANTRARNARISVSLLTFLFVSVVKTKVNIALLTYSREQYGKMKDDIMVHDEERLMMLEKEKGNVRLKIFVMSV